MARDLDLPVEVIVAPTVREPDGLAMSSRNKYLTTQERSAAPLLHDALQAARRCWAGGERDGRALRRVIEATIAREPAFRIDYVSIADPETLEELPCVAGPAVASLAARIGTTRLIDNLRLDEAADA
jgi:pantoate--beta-alanine ligase